MVDLRLPDMSGFELLERLQAEPSLRDIPVVVFTGKELSADEESRLRTLAKSIVLKDVQSPERLLDETALFLHRVIADLPEDKRRMIERLHGSSGSPARAQGAGGRRRRPQHLRPDHHPREPGDGGAERDQRPSGHRAHRQYPRSQRGADGHHDAGDGRLRDHARDPEGPAVSHAADPGADCQGDEGRSREVPGGRAPPTTSRNPSTPSSCCPCCVYGCTDRCRCR